MERLDESDAAIWLEQSHCRNFWITGQRWMK